jgi:hypothetical protein
VSSIAIAVALMTASKVFAAIRDHLERLFVRAVPLEGAAS